MNKPGNNEKDANESVDVFVWPLEIMNTVRSRPSEIPMLSVRNHKSDHIDFKIGREHEIIYAFGYL